MPHKPGNASTVSPYLIVEDAGETIAFLEHVFDAIVLQRFTNNDGMIMHAELQLNESVIMVADGTKQWQPVPAHVHIYVEDVAVTYRRALEAGATPVQEPVKKQDANKRGAVRDKGGTTWWIATNVG